MKTITLIGLNSVLFLLLFGALVTCRMVMASEITEYTAVQPSTMSQSEYQPLRKKMEIQKCKKIVNSKDSDALQVYPLVNFPRCNSGYGQGYDARIIYNNQEDEKRMQTSR